MQNSCRVAAFGAAGQQDHVGRKGRDLGHVVVAQLEAIGAHDLSAGAQCGGAGGLDGQARHQPGDHHAQTPGGATRCPHLHSVERIEPGRQGRQRRDRLSQRPKRPNEPLGDITVHCRGRLGATENPRRVEIDRRHLGEGAAKIDEKG